MNKNQSYGSVVVEKGSHTCTPVSVSFTRAGSQPELPGTLPSLYMVVPAALSAIYTISHFSFPSFFFTPSSLSPGGVCVQLVLPQWCGYFLGSGPSLDPSHLAHRASRPGLGSLEARLFFFFWTSRKRVCLYRSINRKGCEVILHWCLRHLVFL